MAWAGSTELKPLANTKNWRGTFEKNELEMQAKVPLLIAG